MMKLTFSAATLLAVACVSPPPYSVTSGSDVIRGPEPALTEHVAALLAAGRVEMHASVPDLRDTAVDVWIQDRPHGGAFQNPDVEDYNAFVTLRPGARPRIHVPTQGFRDCLLHELGHALLGPTWEPLPQAVEEGLCDLFNRDLADPNKEELRLRCAARAGNSTTYSVSFRIRYPAGEPQVVSSFWGHGGGSDSSSSDLSLARILGLTTLQGASLDPADIDMVYGVGYLLAHRIFESSGVEGLHALCVRARAEGHTTVPADWILAAAGVADEAGFERAARDALRAARIERAFESEELANLLRATIAKAPIDAADSTHGVDALLACTDLTLTIAGEKIALGGQPRFRKWALAHWPAE